MPSPWIASLRRALSSRAAPRPTRSPNRSRTDMGHVTTGARVRQVAALRTPTWFAADAATERPRRLTPNPGGGHQPAAYLERRVCRVRAPAATSARRCLRGLISWAPQLGVFRGISGPINSGGFIQRSARLPAGARPGGMKTAGLSFAGRGLTLTRRSARDSKPDTHIGLFLRKFYLRNVTKTALVRVVELLGCSAGARVGSFLEDSPDQLASSS